MSNVIAQKVGDYKPGYLYGTVKMHKPNHPRHSIISQIPTPFYELTKRIKQLIIPYLPCKYYIKSTHELIKIINTLKPNNGVAKPISTSTLQIFKVKCVRVMTVKDNEGNKAR